MLGKQATPPDLLSVVSQVATESPSLEPTKVSPRDFMERVERLFPKYADDVYWWLIIFGFFRLSTGGSAFELRDGGQLRFQAKPLQGTENDIHLPGWPDAHGAKRFEAPAREQLALIAENGLHGISFR